MMSVEELEFRWIEDIASVGQIREIVLGPRWALSYKTGDELTCCSSSRRLRVSPEFKTVLSLVLFGSGE
jgi:hypothetical protein